MAEILSLAIFETLPTTQAAALATVRELSLVLTRSEYGRDSLYRDTKSGQYILLRHWRSEVARQAALEDPAVLRCWAKLANEIRTVTVMETLEEVGV